MKFRLSYNPNKKLCGGGSAIRFPFTYHFSFHEGKAPSSAFYLAITQYSMENTYCEWLVVALARSSYLCVCYVSERNIPIDCYV